MLKPKFGFSRVWQITPVFLEQHGIDLLLLDVDNTLTIHDSPEVPAELRPWLDQMRASGIKLFVLSNNKQERVQPFADALGIGCVAHAHKPLTGGVRRVCERFQVPASRIAVVGDQLFTDVLCANLAGATSILVQPMQLESFPFFKLKRALERVILRDYWEQRGGSV